MIFPIWQTPCDTFRKIDCWLFYSNEVWVLTQHKGYIFSESTLVWFRLSASNTSSLAPWWKKNTLFVERSNHNSHFVGNKTNRRISKRSLQESKALQISKTDISYSLIHTHSLRQKTRNKRFGQNILLNVRQKQS